MNDTIKDGLNRSNPNVLPSLLNHLDFGDVLASLFKPQVRAFTGLTSSVTQVHDRAELIHSVSVAGTMIPIVPSSATPASGQVAITYDPDTGVPTLLFEAVRTAYEVMVSGGALIVALADPLKS